MELQSEQINEIAAALIKFHDALKQPEKKRNVQVRTKTGGTYNFKYADLDAVYNAIKEPLAEANLAFTQTTMIGNTTTAVVTTLMHKSGQWIRGFYPINGKESPQERGSEFTYAKRYALCGILGIVADEDDDANAASGNTVQQRGAGSQQQPRKSGQQATHGNSTPTNHDVAAKVNIAMGFSDLTEWENKFLTSVDEQIGKGGTISPKQITSLNGIIEKRNKKEPVPTPNDYGVPLERDEIPF